MSLEGKTATVAGGGQGNDEAPDVRSTKLPLTTKLTFSTGSIQIAMVSAAGITTLLYYNQVLGVSPSLCGTAFLIASIVDAVSDPLVGALSDRFRSRWGRRHPFMADVGNPLRPVQSTFSISLWGG